MPPWNWRRERALKKKKRRRKKEIWIIRRGTRRPMQMPCSKFRGGRLILIFESLIPSGDENIDPPCETNTFNCRFIRVCWWQLLTPKSGTNVTVTRSFRKFSPREFLLLLLLLWIFLVRSKTRLIFLKKNLQCRG